MLLPERLLMLLPELCRFRLPSASLLLYPILAAAPQLDRARSQAVIAALQHLYVSRQIQQQNPQLLQGARGRARREDHRAGSSADVVRQ